jgi:hypothetical protein
MKTTSFMNVPDNRVLIGFEPATPNGTWYDTVYTPPLNKYKATYQLWANPATSTRLALDNLKDAENDFFPLYRNFYAIAKANPLATNAYLETMGFPPRPTGGHSRHPVDRLFVHISIMPMGIYTIKVTFENSETGSSIVPDYLTGVVLYYIISDTPVTNPNDLVHSRLATRSPHEISFDPLLRGKTAYLAGRWQNQRGELGPWSSIVSIVIP